MGSWCLSLSPLSLSPSIPLFHARACCRALSCSPSLPLPLSLSLSLVSLSLSPSVSCLLSRRDFLSERWQQLETDRQRRTATNAFRRCFDSCGSMEGVRMPSRHACIQRVSNVPRSCQGDYVGQMLWHSSLRSTELMARGSGALAAPSSPQRFSGT